MRFAAERIKNAFREPSTYAGIGLICGSLGYAVDIDAVKGVGMLAGGVLAMFLRESGTTEKHERASDEEKK